MSQYQPEGTGRQSHLSADVRVDGHLFESPELRRKNLTFAIIMTIIQAVFCFLYGFLIYTPAQLINVTSIVTIIFFAVLIVAGNLALIQGSDSYSVTPNDSRGAASALISSSSPSA